MKLLVLAAVPTLLLVGCGGRPPARDMQTDAHRQSMQLRYLTEIVRIDSNETVFLVPTGFPDRPYLDLLSHTVDVEGLRNSLARVHASGTRPTLVLVFPTEHTDQLYHWMVAATEGVGQLLSSAGMSISDVDLVFDITAEVPSPLPEISTPLPTPTPVPARTP